MNNSQKSIITDKNQWLTGWRRNMLLITLLLVSIFSQIDRILPFIMAESIKADLNLSDTQLGLITGLAFSVCYSFASLPFARISDNGLAKQVLFWCIIIWSIMTGFGGLTTGFVTLALSRFGVALGEAGGTPASHAIIVRKISEKFRGRALGLFSMGIPLGTMLGFSIGGWANDTIGWRNAFFGAGAFGIFVLIMVVLFIQKNNRTKRVIANTGNFFSSAKNLLANPTFRWLFVATNLLGFASAPFYIFVSPFLIRTYGLTAAEVGLSFGILQGLMGVAGTLLGGRLFDRAVSRGSRRLMNPPAIVFSIASITTTAALFMPASWMSITLFIPGMFSFAFLLPHGFGAGHLVAGAGKQALSSGLLMLGSGLLPAALSPFLVGIISDAATAAGVDNGLKMGLLISPLFIVLSGICCFIISRKLIPYLKSEKIV